MNTVFVEWVNLKKESFENDGVNTDDINVAANNVNPSVAVDYSSQSCIGRVSVWQSGLMDIEILHIDTEERLLFEHHQLDGIPDFDKILKKYHTIMVMGKMVK